MIVICSFMFVLYLIKNFNLQILKISWDFKDSPGPRSLAERRTPVLERRKPWNSGQWSW